MLPYVNSTTGIDLISADLNTDHIAAVRHIFILGQQINSAGLLCLPAGHLIRKKLRLCYPLSDKRDLYVVAGPGYPVPPDGDAYPARIGDSCIKRLRRSDPGVQIKRCKCSVRCFLFPSDNRFAVCVRRRRRGGCSFHKTALPASGKEKTTDYPARRVSLHNNRISCSR